MGLDIKDALSKLIPLIALYFVIKGWKQGDWMEVLSSLLIGGLAWSLITGKNIFEVVWQVITGILKFIGLNVG